MTTSIADGVAALRARLDTLRGAYDVDVIGETEAIATALQTLAMGTIQRREAIIQARLARMMEDSEGKAFTTAMTDQVFRARRSVRVADQLRHLMTTHGVPRYLTAFERAQLHAFRWLSHLAPALLVPAVMGRVRKEMNKVVLPGEPHRLTPELGRRVGEGLLVNLNHLGEAILGEDEAATRFEAYLEAARRPDVACVSVKVSSIFSQLELLAWDQTLTQLAERMGRLYQAALDAPHVRPDGTRVPTLIYLDMEEYRDLHLTVALFERVLDDPSMRRSSAGIVLQAYLPDAHPVQRTLTRWAQERVGRGGTPIRLRIVKGANLAMERHDASLHGWAQAPYRTKLEVDANYKRMVRWGAQPTHSEAVHLGIASHNVFDIAYGLVVRAMEGVEVSIGFEMLDGMADPLKRVVHAVAGDMLIYAPSVTREEVQSAIAYLIRRLDENTGPENFLRHSFGLTPGDDTWRREATRFRQAVAAMETVAEGPQRRQDRREAPHHLPEEDPFHNEPDTDFSLPHNREWATEVARRWRGRETEAIPHLVGGQPGEDTRQMVIGVDPSTPDRVLYRYPLATWPDVDRALTVAVNAQVSWATRPVIERAQLLKAIARRLREARGALMGVMMADGAKAIGQADGEISEAIDFAEYYARSLDALMGGEGLTLQPRGVVLVTPPWNFPLAIPAGGVLAALMTGNAVILKPAPETTLVAWHLVQILWAAGIPREALQMVCCPDDPVGSQLVSDPRVDVVILTGSTETAQLFQRMRPDLHLLAETGGKNAMIVSAMADQDLAIKHAISGAFGHAGQKCSATSLLICEAEVYDNPGFMHRLADATRSLHVGPAWDPAAVVTPLIAAPSGPLVEALKGPREGESWLVEPRPDPDNPRLWSPGIKVGVRPGTASHTEELFGPVLSVIRARTLDHAIAVANATPYGLTSGLHSLDTREQARWMATIDAGNIYINRSTTGAIVQRQPFGGRKASGFGPGAKAGGPNYLLQLLHVTQDTAPTAQDTPDATVQALLAAWRDRLEDAEYAHLEASAESAAHWWRTHFTVTHDPSEIVGQDNLFRYQSGNATGGGPGFQIMVRIGSETRPLAVAQCLVAAETTGTPVSVSVAPGVATWLTPEEAVHEDDQGFIDHLRALRPYPVRIRALGTLGTEPLRFALDAGIHVDREPPVASGRVELLRWVREQSVSRDFHRYGNLGGREEERSTPAA
jgi:RHH-type proline utilization regulon transcriptional repressor/proline dehydrogenase/delta 1-pyrroline-5-carboxylate dehydrogenase